MLALSIRQPYAELILRGLKRIEYRSRATTIIGERFYLYASKRPAEGAIRLAAPARLVVSPSLQPAVWSTDLAAGGESPPWMIELANALRLFPRDLPTGVIVGTAVIERCELIGHRQAAAGGEESSQPATDRGRPTHYYQWHLTDVQRAKRLRKPSGHPQPVWWRPF